jgi:hypothetical protein
VEKAILSKSTFVRGLQCSKSLYLHKNNYDLKDPLSSTRQAIFSRGNSVGLLAQKLFPGGKDASPCERFNYSEALAKTQSFLNEGCQVIYEAAFQFNGLYVALDILVKHNSKWIAYEVKSSAKITATYILDAAVQYYVISQSGIELSDIQLVYVNTAYIKEKIIDPAKFFTQISVLEKVVEKQLMVGQKIEELKQVLKATSAPDIQIGEHCHSPYTCDFIGTCRGPLNENSIFYFNGISRQQQYQWYLNGIKNIENIPSDFSLNAEQKIQFDASKNKLVIINQDALSLFLNQLVYPLYFLDFELFMPAIPLYEGTSPYEHIPFLYSVHQKLDKKAKPEHFYFLAETGSNPMKQFVHKLLSDLGEVGDILVFDTTHEKRILAKAASLFPEYKQALAAIVERFKDLSEPFQKKQYYRKEMKGSYSMKSLLPALVHDLDFDNLRIKNGVSALAAFENLQNESDLFQAQEIREALVEYCKMDTFGLVKIIDALEKVTTK